MNEKIFEQLWKALETVEQFTPRANGQQIMKLSITQPEGVNFGSWGMREKFVIEVEYGYDGRTDNDIPV
jgi:hypothetical protein